MINCLLMKRVWILLVSLFCCQPLWAEGAKTYTNSHFLYSIDYPADWRVKELSKIAMFVAPLENEADFFAENVTVVAEDLSQVPGSVSLIEYHRKSSGGASKMLQDYKPLEEAQTIWQGREAVIELYTATVRAKKFRFKAVKFMAGTTVYVLTYTAEEDSYEKFLASCDRLMATIRVSP